MEIQVNGLDRLLKKLDSLGGNMDQAVNKGMMQVGVKMRDAAKILCPVDSGHLRDTIETASPSLDTVTTGTNVEYGPDVEYGTGPKGDPEVPHTTKEFWRYKDPKTDQWVTSHGQAPQPFLRPAFAQYKDKAGEIVKKEIENEIKELS